MYLYVGLGVWQETTVAACTHHVTSRILGGLQLGSIPTCIYMVCERADLADYIIPVVD